MSKMTKSDWVIAGVGVLLCWALWFGPLAPSKSRSTGGAVSGYTPPPSQPVSRIEITMKRR